MLDIDADSIALIQKILADYVPDKTVLAYGSRVKGNAHSGSDLDLVLIDPENKDISEQLSALREAFSESDLPILVDVLDWASIPESFKNEIKEINVVLQEAHKK